VAHKSRNWKQKMKIPKSLLKSFLLKTYRFPQCLDMLYLILSWAILLNKSSSKKYLKKSYGVCNYLKLSGKSVVLINTNDTLVIFYLHNKCLCLETCSSGFSIPTFAAISGSHITSVISCFSKSFAVNLLNWPWFRYHRNLWICFNSLVVSSI